MRRHRGFTLLESLVAMLLLPSLLFTVGQYISVTTGVGLDGQTIRTQQVQEEIFWLDFLAEVKSAEGFQVSEETLTLFFTQDAVSYTFASNGLLRSDGQGTEAAMEGVVGEFSALGDTTILVTLGTTTLTLEVAP